MLLLRLSLAVAVATGFVAELAPARRLAPRRLAAAREPEIAEPALSASIPPALENERERAWWAKYSSLPGEERFLRLTNASAGYGFRQNRECVQLVFELPPFVSTVPGAARKCVAEFRVSPTQLWLTLTRRKPLAAGIVSETLVLDLAGAALAARVRPESSFWSVEEAEAPEGERAAGTAVLVELAKAQPGRDWDRVLLAPGEAAAATKLSAKSAMPRCVRRRRPQANFVRRAQVL